MFKKFVFSIFMFLICLSYNVNAEEIKNVHYFENVVNTGKDNGFSNKEQIKKGDPHYGWKLGKFVISNFSGKTTDENGNLVFLKNSNDEIELSFNLLQDINKLDGDKNLVINEDKNGYDNEFNVKQTNFKYGTLIVRKTDSSGNVNKPVLYRDYIKGVKIGSNTKIILFEEGDYEVALDYEIKNNGLLFFDSYYNYSIRFKFSVRNGNCMVFPFDSKTKSELVNTSFTSNGFYLDFAKSQYLNVIVKKEVLKEGSSGLVEDVRFNRPAKVGEVYSDEGIYTITAKNDYTNEQTIKKIYVGNNNILKAHVQTGYTINDLNQMIKQGASIDDNGNLLNIPKEFIVSSNSSELENLDNSFVNDLFNYIYIIIPLIFVLIFVIVKVKSHKIEQKQIYNRIKEKENELDDEEENNEDN